MPQPSTIGPAGTDWRCMDLRTVAGDALDLLPFSFRILLENAVRAERAADAHAILQWLDHRGAAGSVVTFAPRRILMHDTTAVPALVDLAAMRDVLAETGGAALHLACPVDIAIDHSVTLDAWGDKGAMARNRWLEMTRHAERYAFLKWAGQAFDGVTVHPPGRAILHTLNLEQLARVVHEIATPDGPLLVPDTMIGTDSHTPMINALGVLGWGVGGLEAEAAMLGNPMPVRLPEVIGVRLTGRLRPGVLGTDLALHVTALLRARDVVGAFVEFYGPGLRGLSVGTRAAVANMAPEYGATTGYFPVDGAVTAYLSETGRSPSHVARVEAFARATGLWGETDSAPEYTDTISVDLSALDAIAAGPNRPHDRKPLSALTQPARPRPAAEDASDIPHHAVAIAAITSCTATADLEALVTAALLARRAAALGLSVPTWVKTSFAPGSAAVLNALAAGGLMPDLERLGFHAAAIGCTTCIGNSGPLTPSMAKAIAEEPGRTRCAVLSGNRNFPGRIHADITEAWLVSPPLVVAFALAGRRIDVGAEPLGYAAGEPVTLARIWPAPDEVALAMTDCRSPLHTQAAYGPTSSMAEWDALEAPRGERYDWQPGSTVLRTPPFVRAAQALPCPATLRLRVLAAFGDDVTTDHISPAGAIPPGSSAARHLAARASGLVRQATSLPGAAISRSWSGAPSPTARWSTSSHRTCRPDRRVCRRGAKRCRSTTRR